MIDHDLLNLQFLVYIKLLRPSGRLRNDTSHRLLLRTLRTSTQVALTEESGSQDEARSAVAQVPDPHERQEAEREQDENFVIDLTRMFAKLSLN